jgi:DNA-binding PadR family transcriptional regulator
MLSDRPPPALSDLAFHVLLALGDEPTHGYEIGQRVEHLSQGRLDPTTGALYQALRRLVDEALIEHVETPPGVDARRKYVAITNAGRAAMRAEAARLERLVTFAKAQYLEPGRA